MLWKRAINDEVAAHKNLGTFSTIKCSNKQDKAAKTPFVLDIKHDADGKDALQDAAGGPRFQPSSCALFRRDVCACTQHGDVT